MNLVSRSQRILALLMGLAVLATVIFQVLKEGHRIEKEHIRNIQSNIK